tara:strand:+ start:548 stop:1165 length:618 start_codon:yes stop_codon:yes gene_type:complete
MTNQFKKTSTILVHHYNPNAEEAPEATFLNAHLAFDSATRGVTYSTSCSEASDIEEQDVECALFEGKTLFGRFQDESEITERVTSVTIEPQTGSLFEKLLHANFLQMKAEGTDVFMPTLPQFELSDCAKKALVKLTYDPNELAYQEGVALLTNIPVMTLSTQLHSAVDIHLEDLFRSTYNPKSNTYNFNVDGKKFEIAIQKLINL